MELMKKITTSEALFRFKKKTAPIELWKTLKPADKIIEQDNFS